MGTDSNLREEGESYPPAPAPPRNKNLMLVLAPMSLMTDASDALSKSVLT